MNESMERDLLDYYGLFVQVGPPHGRKTKRGWRTLDKPLTRRVALGHVERKIIVGSLAPWYPVSGCFDFDNQPFERVLEIREKVGLNESNSLLFSSESPDSYHLYFRPEYNNRPATVRLLQDVLRELGSKYSIEIYPQKSRFFRLPLGKYQLPLDIGHEHLIGPDDWVKNLHWFNKLDPFNLGNVPGHQIPLHLAGQGVIYRGSIYEMGREYFECGLQAPSTRHEAQWAVVNFLAMNNLDRDSVLRKTKRWIYSKHNGFSRDILSHPRAVEGEIDRQTDKLFGNCEFAGVLPNLPHNRHSGFITRPDLPEIVKICGGSMPRIKLLFGLVKYFYPRRHRDRVSIHSDWLIEWSSKRMYQTYLNELEEKGLVERGRGYRPREMSKSIKLAWKFRDSSQAVLYTGRAFNSFGESISHVFLPRDFRAMLESAGAERTAALKATQTIYSESTRVIRV